MARYTGEERRVLQTASVIGRTFDVELLDIVMNFGGSERLEEFLERCRSDGLLIRFRRPDGTYGFPSNEVRNRFHSNLTKANRKRIHGIVARTIEELYASNLAPHHSNLAFHYSLSAHPEKAAHYYRILGDAASDRTIPP